MVGFCFVIAMQRFPKLMGPGWDPGFLIVMFLCGIGVGYAGMARGERLRSLPVVGFNFNLALLLLGFFMQ